MTLDLAQIVGQTVQMARQIKQDAGRKELALRLARETLHLWASDWPALANKIEQAPRRTSLGLVAGLQEGLAESYSAPDTPSNYVVLATDGSHMELDRHAPVPCYLLNIGSVLLSYGDRPQARLDRQASLFSEDLLGEPAEVPEGELGEVTDASLVGVQRSVAEARRLADLVERDAAEGPTLALLDGTLLLWLPEGPAVERPQLQSQFSRQLDRIQHTAEKGAVVLASYISSPRSREVMGALRAALCRFYPDPCPARHPDATEVCPCAGLLGLRDRDLWSALLRAGERSPLFRSRSRANYQGRNAMHFFYLAAGEEIARVEVPAWVAQDQERLALAHSLVWDQCRRGRGYPVALMEAHEQAVVTPRDRESFWALMEAALAQQRLPARGSAKHRSKRLPWV